MKQNEKKPYKIDIAVLLIFFCRSEQFRQVFEQVKAARPSKLYLYQDGAREGNEKDIAGIEDCRKIAEDIDWDCEIHTYYQEKNVGCDPSEFIAQKWMFETEEMGIVLEDDDVPSQSFFVFCKELLEKYKDDERIHMICGMNNTEVSDHIDESYLFTTKGSCWGWASWKRVVDQWDETYPWLDRKGDLKNLEGQFLHKYEYENCVRYSSNHRSSGRAHYETIGGMDVYLYNRLNIVPKYNMISNIGVATETTHGADDIRLYPKKVAKLMNMKRYEIEFPLKHPKYMMADRTFEALVDVSPFDNWKNKWESRLRYVRYKGLSAVAEKVKKKFAK